MTAFISLTRPNQDHFLRAADHRYISSGTSDGLAVVNAGWYHATGINFVGQDDGTHSSDGIHFQITNDQSKLPGA